MVSFDVTGTEIGSPPAQAQRKQWSSPRVIMSEVRQDTAGGLFVNVNESTTPGYGTIS